MSATLTIKAFLMRIYQLGMYSGRMELSALQALVLLAALILGNKFCQPY
jgi:hypothetical protein